MKVIKRDGKLEDVSFDKIKNRISKACEHEINGKIDKLKVDIDLLTQKVIQGLHDNIRSTELDELTAQIATDLSTKHSDYNILASSIIISNHHRNTLDSFSDTIELLYNNKDYHGKLCPLVSDELYDIVMENKDIIESTIEYERDYNIDYFGFKTLEKSYLLKVDNQVLERPQDLFMRVSIGIHGSDMNAVIETYDCMSQQFFIHATPTLFNAGTPRPTLASCYLLAMDDDSVSGIYKTLTDCAHISKMAGGIGFHIHNIRSKNSYIRGTNGHSNGVVPMLKVYNETARYIDQGGGKRQGSFAVYIEPWHADIFQYIELKRNQGSEHLRARDLFYALWIPDLFMKRLEQDSHWSLMCPDQCPGLSDCFGKEFEDLYLTYENEKRYVKQIKARELWTEVIKTQIETGTPYMLYKDRCNENSNQQNLGTIKSSNLCAEIVEYSSSEETAVCNLASIGLPSFLKYENDLVVYDYDLLHNIVKIITKNLNKVIDRTEYPTPETKYSNLKNRPIGIGVQGLADTFIKLRIPFDSNEAKEVNKKIFETIYHSALETSCELAKENGTYESYEDSPISKGILHFDHYDVKPNMWDWDKLRYRIQKYGVRNSLLIALMPTASTSQIMGFNECFEPITSNVYIRRTLSGEFKIINTDLVCDLIQLELWDEDMKNKIIYYNGSIQKIKEIPENIRNIYKTVWDISQKVIIDMAADRGAFVDQSQSMNIYVENPTISKLSSMHMYGWKKGLKTGSYYIRQQTAHRAQQTTIDPNLVKQIQNENDGEVCTMQDGCLMCGS